MAHVVVKVARNAGLVALFIVAAMLGVLSGVMFAYAGDLPQVSALDNYSPSTITRIYASGGQVIMPLTEVAPDTTIALFADPEGHVVGIM